MNFRDLDYLYVLRDMKMLFFPRVFGYPLQKMTADVEQLVAFLRLFNGKGPCFTSHNAYNKFNDYGDPIEVCMSNLFFDFDDDKKIENAQLDAGNLAEHLESHNLDYSITFSGSKGFHVYVHLKDEIMIIDNSLRMKYTAIHNWVGQTARTADPHVADVRRLCRIPGTEHVKNPGRHCIPQTLEQIKLLTIPEIIDLSKKPQKTIRYYRISKRHGKQITLDDFMELMGIDPQKSNLGHGNTVLRRLNPNKDKVGAGDTEPFIQYLKQLIWRPCIWSELSTPNPLHFVRFCAAVQLIQAMQDFGEVCDAWDQLAEFFGYVDRFRMTRGMLVSHNQIRHIMSRGYHHPSREKLGNLCFGDDCPECERCS